MRNYGLDVIRSIAILLVLFCHLTMFVSQHYDTLGVMFVSGYLGVEFFFVLSGFLIGKQIINVYENRSWNSLKVFYAKRWYRTLPLYFLVVLILIIAKGSFAWENLFFIQNFDEQALNFNPVSWSLSIEEWFYLTIPFLFLIISKFSRKSTGSLFLYFSIGFVIAELLLRIILANSITTWDFGARKQIFLRLDSIMIGVLLAGIKYYYKDFYKKFVQSKFLLLISSIAFLYFGVFYFYKIIVENTVNFSFFGKTFLFTVVSLCIAVFVAHAETIQSLNPSKRNILLGRIIKFVSITSYAVYLIHYEIFVFVNTMISNFDFSLTAIFIVMLLVSGTVYLIAYLLHKFFEKPIMRYRDKKYSKT